MLPLSCLLHVVALIGLGSGPDVLQEPLTTIPSRSRGVNTVYADALVAEGLRCHDSCDTRVALIRLHLRSPPYCSAVDACRPRNRSLEENPPGLQTWSGAEPQTLLCEGSECRRGVRRALGAPSGRCRAGASRGDSTRLGERSGGAKGRTRSVTLQAALSLPEENTTGGDNDKWRAMWV